jgi:outer membrane protein assembly factor BamB
MMIVLAVALAWMTPAAPQPQPPSSAVPSTLLRYREFTMRFAPDGSFELQGTGYPTFKGTWKAQGANEVEIVAPNNRGACPEPARYRIRTEQRWTILDVVNDPCANRQFFLDRSTWLPEGVSVKDVLPPRKIVRTASPRRAALPAAAPATGSWPSFRGTLASGIADGANLPDTWDGAKGTNILWRAAVPGLAHSSPIVWGNRLFVTTAISSTADASFKPGLYGEGTASADRSRHRWAVLCYDKATGKLLWQRDAHVGEPREKRHIKSTYASATPATDGRIVVASFGSQGVYAYDVAGTPLWSVDLGRMDVGAYDIPSYEWGTASSPIIWEDLVILQVDTQVDSFLIALNAATGETAWKTDREELPSWGTPTVAPTSGGPVLVTNASNFIRGYDPRTGKELWRLGGSSKITAPTPIFADGVFVVASGRGPERPIFAIRPGAQGNITLEQGKTSNDSVAWSKTGRGSYMPTPLVYKGILYVLANNGVLDAYDVKTGEEIYRQRLSTVGNGFSASPVAADDKLYLSNEDGDVIVVKAGREFAQLAVNPMGDLVMATPALSGSVMYVRTARSLFAIGRPR